MDLDVRVPATVANLGPGFDCLGVAVGIRLVMRVSESQDREITGKGRIRSAKDSLIFKSWDAAFGAAGQSPPNVRLEMLEIYPSARGLGASASAIVSGLVAARAVGDLSLEDSDLARLAIDIEGHGDNVLPALFGGLVLSSPGGWIRYEPTDEVLPLILIAREGFKTKAARSVLPETIPMDDAVANSAAVAALVEVLSGRGPLESLMLATEDRFHEPYRLPLMPESQKLHGTLRENGIPATLAGAGPSLICLVTRDRLQEALDLTEGLKPDGWSIALPGWDLTGAEVK